MLTKKQVEQRLKEGRGSLLKHGNDYCPFYDYRDKNLLGNRVQIMSHTVGRIHHGASQLEGNVITLLDWEPPVVDLREQAALEKERTDAIYKELDFPVPRGPVPLTIDIVYTYLLDGKKRFKPLEVKYAKYLEDIKVIRNFEVKRFYFHSLGSDSSSWDDCQLVTERDIPPIYLSNIQTLRNYYQLADHGITDDLLQYVQKPLTMAVLQSSHLPLKLVARQMDEKIGSDAIVSLQIAYYLIANRKLQVDLHSGLIAETPLDILSVSEDLLESVKK